ncbi:hypothetical protein R1flu_001168 [Riccia fluitans]|uniref:Uncharacterized protein n=1 Tax=Riccia fluitans TaxID=41844 RepID=A0ABD1Y2I9_9MARC
MTPQKRAKVTRKCRLGLSIVLRDKFQRTVSAALKQVPWSECREERSLQLSRLLSDVAKQTFGNQRAFLRDRKKQLTDEIVKDPKKFWKRVNFKPVQQPDPGALIEMVRSLYFAPHAFSMPPASFRGTLFSELLVQEHLSKMASVSKALHLTSARNWEAFLGGCKIQVERRLKKMSGGEAKDFEGLSVDCCSVGDQLSYLNLPLSLMRLSPEACLRTGLIGEPFPILSLALGSHKPVTFEFKGRQLELAKSYQYLGIDFALGWLLFRTSVQTVVLYGMEIWGPATSASDWYRIEAVLKAFLRSELVVKVQTPFAIMLAEIGAVSLEAVALFFARKYVLRIKFSPSKVGGGKVAEIRVAPWNLQCIYLCSQ